MSAEDFRKAMDADDGFKNKRRNLFLLSILLIAIVVSGADIKEANSLIFKIEFADHENLKWLLIAGICYSVLRYYAYSETYRNKLVEQWSSKMMGDRAVYYYSEYSEEVGGLLEKAVDVYGGDEPGLINAVYIRTGLFKRVIEYPSMEVHGEDGPQHFRRLIDLNNYNENWKRRDFMLLLWIELKYRLNAWVAHRETLDLVAPYVLAAGALAAFFYKQRC